MEKFNLITSEIKRFAERELVSKPIKKTSQKEPFGEILSKLKTLEEFTTKLSPHMNKFFEDNNIELTDKETEIIQNEIPRILESAIDKHFSK